MKRKITGALFLLLITAPLYSQNHFYVSTTGSNTNGGSAWNDAWKTISFALTASSGSDIIIHVAAGTYVESGITIDKSLKLQAEPGAILDGTTLPYGAGIKVAANGVTIDGFEITGFRKGIVSGNGSSYSNLVIRNNHIHHTKNYTQISFPEGYPAEGIHIGWQSENWGGPTGEPKGTAYATFDGLIIEGNSIHDTWDAIALRFVQASTAASTIIARNNDLHDNRFDGFSLDCVRKCSIHDNRIANNRGSGIVMVSTGDYPGPASDASVWGAYTPITDGALAPKDVNITRNEFTGNGSYGGSYSTMIDNAITLTGGWPEAIVVSLNRINANARAISNHTSKILSAEYNWWGSVHGPLDAAGTSEIDLSSCGSSTVAQMKNAAPARALGNSVSNLVDYCPWLASPSTVEFLPGVANITGNSPSQQAQVCVQYAGGGSGKIFGYNVKFTYDPTVVLVRSVTSGTLFGSDVGAFKVTESTPPGKVTVNSSLFAPNPGKDGPGSLFCVTFEAVDDCGESALDIVPVSFRDASNHALNGILEADGVIKVDLFAPEVTGTHIANETVRPVTGSDLYAKDGDHLVVTATISDNCATLTPSMITADLQAFGGGAAVPPDSYTGGVATWDIGHANLTPADGSAAVTITATDLLGNTGTGNESLTADNTAPVPAKNLKARPRHEHTLLEWDAGSDAALYGYMIKQSQTSDYPVYALSLPAYPGASDFAAPYAAGGSEFQVKDPSGHTPGTSYLYDFESTPDARGISSFTVATFDMALNSSVDASSSERATDYYLGDFLKVGDTAPSGQYDGEVNFTDLGWFTLQYWATSLTAAQQHADIGPTVGNERTYSAGDRFALPHPDGMIEFEDLMIFSMNYDQVHPEPKSGMLSREFALVLDREEGAGALSVRVRLDNDGKPVKGTSFTLSYDPRVVTVKTVTAGDLFGEAGRSALFMHKSETGKIRCDASMLGTDASVQHSGTVATIDFEVLGAGDPGLTFDGVRVRDERNRALSVRLKTAGGVPTGYALTQNYPNPFNPTTTIGYTVATAGEVRIAVYNALGSRVATLAGGMHEAGSYEVNWDGTDDGGSQVPSGLYYYTMTAGSYSATRSMSLVK